MNIPEKLIFNEYQIFSSRRINYISDNDLYDLYNPIHSPRTMKVLFRKKGDYVYTHGIDIDTFLNKEDDLFILEETTTGAQFKTFENDISINIIYEYPLEKEVMYTHKGIKSPYELIHAIINDYKKIYSCETHEVWEHLSELNLKSLYISKIKDSTIWVYPNFE